MEEKTAQQRASLEHHKRQKAKGIKRFSIELCQEDVEELKKYKEENIKGLSIPISNLLKEVQRLRKEYKDILKKNYALELPQREAESRKIIKEMKGIDKNLIETVLKAKNLPLLNDIEFEEFQLEEIPSRTEEKEKYKLYLYENIIELKDKGLSSSQIAKKWNAEQIFTETGLEWTSKNITRIHKIAKEYNWRKVPL